MNDPNSYMAETMPLHQAAPRRRGRSEYRMIAAPGDANHTLLPARALAIVEGFAMVRRPGATTRPFVVPEEDWAKAPLQERGT